MLDLKFIRENADLVRQAVANRQDNAPLGEILNLDVEYRQKILELEELRHTRKEASRQKNTSEEAINRGRELRSRIRVLEEETRGLDEQLEKLLLQVPNIPHSSVPWGEGETDNVVVRSSLGTG